MSTIVADCPRCGASRSTFDVKGENVFAWSYNWQRHYELPCVCRHCHRFSILIGEQSDYGADAFLSKVGALMSYQGSANDYVKVTSFISLKDRDSEPAPEHLPQEILAAFNEGARCMAVKCPNAAAAMFRLCIDIATRPLLPAGDMND